LFLWIITINFALILVKKSLAFDEKRYAGHSFFSKGLQLLK